ncbi:ATP synthase F1 subunit epsilon [Buchnera aphidicola (Hormaphis cornu)]|nr:ATP synthase F1 subunit epsilon [Buchnera aphidicola (Hormaphis cornu)]
MTFFLNIISYESSIFLKYIKKIRVSGSEGELGIYPRHVHFLTSLKPGLLYILDKNAKEKYFYISKGILEVTPTVITVLVDIAICSTTMNEDNLLAEKQDIENKIKSNMKDSDINKFKKTLFEIILKLNILEIMKKSRLKN